MGYQVPLDPGHRTARLRRLGGECLKKVPQLGYFDNLLSGQNGGDQFTLRSGVDLVQVVLRCRLGREFAYALVKSALHNEIGSGVADTSPVERWPFPENSGSIKFDLSVRIGHGSGLSSEHGPAFGLAKGEAGAVPGHRMDCSCVPHLNTLTYNFVTLFTLWKTPPILKLTRSRIDSSFAAWAKPNDRHALVVGRISFSRCLLASSERAYSGALSVTAPIP